MSSERGRPVVVGVDGSDSARQAAFWAAEEAARRNVPVRLVTVVQLPVFQHPGVARLTVADTDEVRAHAGDRLVALKKEVLERHAGLDVHVAVRVDQLDSALIEESANALLMVVGSRGLGGFEGALVGSTGVTLATHGHCPVAVIRPGTPAGPVVVGVDGSPTSETAVGLAFEEASLRGAELVAVHTWVDYTAEVFYGSPELYQVESDAIEVREQELLAEQLAGWQERYPDVAVRRVVSQDRPVRCLLEQAADAQLLVVGSRGRGGFTGMLLGSTSQALVYHAPCPLLVARPQAG